MPIFTKVAGVWKRLSASSVKVDGVWKTIATSTVASPTKYVKVDGTWKPIYDADTSLTLYTLAGVSVLSSTTYTAASGATSVRVKATSTDAAATVSIRRGSAIGTVLSTGTGSVGGSTGYSFSISTANNGTTSNRVVVRVEINGVSQDYPVDITAVASSGGGGGGTTSVTVYYVYCDSSGVAQSGSTTDTSTTSSTTACANAKSALGNPSNWACGTTPPATPSCGGTTPPSPCCQANYTDCLANIASCSNGPGSITYYYDPCAGTTCSPASVTVCGVC